MNGFDPMRGQLDRINRIEMMDKIPFNKAIFTNPL
jgi:hypothetical protein